ncbi:MAG: hypothetical protein HUU56_05435 [Bdellovibrionaceae bacterium]|nr:hypothetical protein [Pseudobdellovibrionaceae bacterium]
MKKKLLVFLSCCYFFGCNKGNFKTVSDMEQPVQKTEAPSTNPTEPDVAVTPSPDPIPKPGEVPVVVSPILKICSQLNFQGISWPDTLSNNEKNYLALAMNITGSFEGAKGWANLSNNFDGMGISLGLMQQNLGMGSLQPMLMEAMTSVAIGKVVFDRNKYNLLVQMLQQWHLDLSNSLVQSDSNELFKNDYQIISELDNNETQLNSLAVDYSINKGSTVINKRSVSWALDELFIDKGKTFRTDWAKELNTLATDKEYISIQVKHSLAIYARALQYFKAFGLTEVRSFLLMYDFVTQNGGFKKKVLTDYTAFIKANPKTTETQRLEKILEIRIKDVLAQWQSDVRSRKQTIINSTGLVHGAKRALTKEYCYVATDKILIQN